METGLQDAQKYKPYLIPAIAALALVALVPLVILPWVSDVRTDFTQVGASRDKLEVMKTKADALEKMDIAAKKNILERQVEPAMPSEADPSGVLETVQQVARGSGLTVVSVNYGAEASTPAATESGVEGASQVASSVTLSGSYPGILSFVTQSEKIARVINLSTIHIAAGDGESLTAIFDILAPYHSTPTDLGPVEEPLPEETSAVTLTLAKVTKLSKAAYAPTPGGDINGKQNPFN